MELFILLLCFSVFHIEINGASIHLITPMEGLRIIFDSLFPSFPLANLLTKSIDSNSISGPFLIFFVNNQGQSKSSLCWTTGHCFFISYQSSACPVSSSHTGLLSVPLMMLSNNAAFCTCSFFLEHSFLCSGIANHPQVSVQMLLS